MKIAVVGAGVSGLASALIFGRSGHQVTVIERDRTPLPATADDAFEWDRRGAPQVRHSHAFLSRLYTLLRDGYPDVLDALLAAGATEMRFGDSLPPTMTDFVPEDGDRDLVMLACRRTTFEWVLRRLALAEPGVSILDGDPVVGLLAPEAEVPAVTGVRLASGRRRDADLTVVANGRRSSLPRWLDALGTRSVPEQVDDTGIVYYSRFYRLAQEAAYPPREGPIGGDLGYLKYGVFVGDNRTFSVTLATATEDEALRKLLTATESFDRAAAALLATRQWIDPNRATPITSVHVMAGLINRARRFVVDGRPVALGVHAVGDARVCTNPLYGRGCATGFWSAAILAVAVRDNPHDLTAQAIAYDAAIDEEIGPFYRSSVTQDAEARRVAAAVLAGQDPDDPDDPRSFMRSVFRDGLLPALRTDAKVLRAFFRGFNLLDAPETMIKDTDLSTRVLHAWHDRGNRPPPPAMGPDRAEMLRLLTA